MHSEMHHVKPFHMFEYTNLTLVLFSCEQTLKYSFTDEKTNNNCFSHFKSLFGKETFSVFSGKLTLWY